MLVPRNVCSVLPDISMTRIKVFAFAHQIPAQLASCPITGTSLMVNVSFVVNINIMTAAQPHVSVAQLVLHSTVLPSNVSVLPKPPISPATGSVLRVCLRQNGMLKLWRVCLDLSYSINSNR
jgi:hypothetical protein